MRPKSTGGRRAAFLDRDGVINTDHGYVHRWDEFEFVPGVIKAMQRLHRAGYALVVVTNQSGIARGMYTEQEFLQLSTQMQAHLGSLGVPITGIYHCPHHPKGQVPAYAIDCACRKPAPGLILQGIAQHGLDPAASFLVGDKLSDLQAARAAGVAHAYLVTGKAGEEEAGAGQAADGVFDSLASFVDWLLPDTMAQPTSSR